MRQAHCLFVLFDEILAPKLTIVTIQLSVRVAIKYTNHISQKGAYIDRTCFFYVAKIKQLIYREN